MCHKDYLRYKICSVILPAYMVKYKLYDKRNKNIL